MPPTPLSFEFFPPKTPQGLDAAQHTALQLSKTNPHYFSVTYGAGGSNQAFSASTIQMLTTHTTIPITPHITCIGSTREKIAQLLDHYRTKNIRRLVAIRGDLPPDVENPTRDFAHANELVHFIREHSGSHFHISVAAYPEFHPETNHYQQGLKRFQEKIAAGANSAITQYFFVPCAYFYFREACDKLNITVPIIPGIMPITNYKQLARFSALCGAEIPRWLSRRLESYGDDLESIEKLGEEVVTNLCDQLIKGGAPALHFYSLNKAEPSLKIINNLRLAATIIETEKSIAA